jgi:hypothetical protein
MIYLKKISQVRGRMLGLKRSIPVYWQDLALKMVLVNRHLQHGQPPGEVLITGKVLALLDTGIGSPILIPGLNIVTNDGDQYYAQTALGETPTDDFRGASAGLRLGSASTSPTKTDTDVTTFLSGTGIALAATYPKTDDGDSDNVGAGVDVATWTYAYGTGDGNATGIQEGAIVDNRTTPTAALTHFLFGAAFNKTSSDTLKVIVNHTMTGS